MVRKPVSRVGEDNAPAYYAFRERLSKELLRQTGPQNASEVVDYAVYCDAPNEVVASEWAERFQHDIGRRRTPKPKENERG